MGKKLLKTIMLLVVCLPHYATVQDEVLPFVSLRFEGPVRAVVTDPQGHQTGSQGFAVFEEADKAVQTLRTGDQSVAYYSPVEGEYLFNLTSQYREEYVFTISWYDGSEYYQQVYQGFAHAGGETKFTMTFSKTSEGWSFDSPAFIVPFLHISKQANHASLYWEALPEAKQYLIYTKKEAEPTFSLLATTASTSLATSIAWAEAGKSALAPKGVVYFAVAAERDGEETFFSRLVNNADQDSDGYNDFREVTLGTNLQEPDSDADGLSDFVEVNRSQTNPRDSDSDDDGYDDSEEVAAGSLPRQASSTPESAKPCEAPERGEWQVAGHCQVEVDQQVAGDVLIYPQAILELMENVTLWFDYTRHKIMVMFGGSLRLKPGASIKQVAE